MDETLIQRMRADQLGRQLEKALVKIGNGEQKFEALTAELTNPEGCPKDFPGKLEEFKNAVGGCMWRDLKNSPALLQLVEEHFKTVGLNRLTKFRDKLTELVKDHMNAQEVSELVKLLPIFGSK